LSSVYANLPEIECEIWVVDNASSDESVQMVKECYPQVHLIENQKNEGFSRANNLAIRKSDGDYVWLLNSDTELEKDALEKLYRFMQSHPGAGASGSMYLNPDGTLQVSCYPRPTLSREFWRLFHLDSFRFHGVYNMDTWDMNDPREVEVLQGASLLLRRDAIDQVGLLDEDYFMYTEEVDLCYRLKNSGWDLYWVPQSKIVHYGGQSTQQVASKMFLSLYETKLLYFRKNHGSSSAFIYKVILSIMSLIRIIFSPLAFWKSPSDRIKYTQLSENYLRLLKRIPSM